MSEYKDISEEHVLEVENKLKNAPTMKEIWNIINETFPNWVINISDCYSEDYIHLQQNFNYLKKNNKYKHIVILCVDKIIQDSEHKILSMFYNLLLEIGYVIRVKEDIVFCTVCNRAIPSEKVFYEMKKIDDIKDKIPEEWLNKCSKC